MKFYSEVTKQFYDSLKDGETAEQEALFAKKRAEEEKERLLAERKARADEVEEARKAMVKAQDEYKKVLNNFLRDYKTYHYSTSNIDDIPSFFDWLLNF